jgi:hypothetical protein
MSKNEKSQEAYIELDDNENLIINGVMTTVEDEETLTIRYCAFEGKQTNLQEIKITKSEKPTMVLLEEVK